MLLTKIKVLASILEEYRPFHRGRSDGETPIALDGKPQRQPEPTIITYLVSTSTGSFMTLPTQKLQAPKLLADAIPETPSYQETPSVGTSQKDPMINQGLQHEQYIGLFAVAVGAIVIIRFLSPKVEYALLFAVALSIILIAFFLTV